ncbi:gliding motility-associated C-terminal domain-containing protein [Costertonia aggregata]|uniref:Gliding motility-associated C-terminal domain-containing protein n=1 Tax=Costertonia aggregata TaxID=343403 RepID=A0A7H9ALS0_9FLAO|nr:gliding motility-associated C-terminal domain-containing protein [Costertonia aggregata]QLG44323.1 gliding motility-associated C-terminal domain-containing protein [Costertonia aggregata]
MKNLLHISFFLVIVLGNAQTALYNSGNLRIHENGQLGFHTNLINDNAFDQNLGLTGFYGAERVGVSGAFAPTFYDVEIANDAGVALDVGLNIENNVNFIVGDFITPRNLEVIYLNFLQNSFYSGEADISKINGYAQMENRQMFSFPVGDALHLRPLILNSQLVNTFARCAYFREDPGNPVSIDEEFDRDDRPRTMGEISATEFWRLNGTVPSTVTLSWNAQSNMVDIASELDNITIVGWNKSIRRWVEIGVTARSGDITEGFAISETFNPDDFDALSFAGVPVPTDTFAVNNPTLGNYYISPNGDGRNDFLVFDDLGESPNNFLQIYDRYGLKVFEATNYVDEFGGTSNVDNLVVNRAAGLPNGVYFYVMNLLDLELNYQGFLYLDR